MDSANIGSDGVETRLVRTVAAFAGALVMIAALHAFSAPLGVYAILFVPFSGAFLLAYQALFKT